MENLNSIKDSFIDDLIKQRNLGIIEKSKSDLLIKLIKQADNISEAISILEMGTVYKNTGFYFDKNLDIFNRPKRKLVKEDSYSLSNGGVVHNLIIGDNYDVLLYLLDEYKSKIGLIYIDPPYGKDAQGYSAKTDYINKLDKDNLLSLLYPRLCLSKELLSNGGIIFCSIDDKNYAYVKCLFDEIFGIESYIATFLWKKTDTPPSLGNKVRKKYEFILCYGKNVNVSHKFIQGLIDGDDIPFINKLNKTKEVVFPKGSVQFWIPDGVYTSKDNMKVKLLTPVIVKDGYNAEEFRAEGNWRWTQATIDSEVKNGTYFIVKTNKFAFRFKRENREIYKTPQNNLDSTIDIGTNEDAEKELKELLGEKLFDNPKPVSLIKFLIKMVNLDKDIVVLDFFAGSGTTGQAVIELNQEDKGSRKFILCTKNEITDKAKKGIAYDVTLRRLNKVLENSCYSENSLLVFTMK